MEVALLNVPVRLRTAGGGPMDPCFDDILLLGLFELLDPDPGLLVASFPLVAILIPPNWVAIETSLPDGFLGGAKMERSSAIFFLGVPLFRMVKLSVPLVIPEKKAPPLEDAPKREVAVKDEYFGIVPVLLSALGSSLLPNAVALLFIGGPLVVWLNPLLCPYAVLGLVPPILLDA